MVSSGFGLFLIPSGTHHLTQNTLLSLRLQFKTGLKMGNKYSECFNIFENFERFEKWLKMSKDCKMASLVADCFIRFLKHWFL